jgi:hypothetical protein
MSDQNLPDLNESNQMINPQPTTASNQIVPSAAIINGNFFVITASGNVGIGTNNPSQSVVHIGDGPTPLGGYRPWMVRGTLVSEDTDGVFFGLKNEDSDRKDAVIAWGDNPADVFRFIFTADKGSADGQEIMRLQPNGNVGIGTNNPQSMLHIGDGLPTLPTGGYRPWMVRGTQVSWDSDNVFFGLKDEGSNRKDSVIAWGDDPIDVFRFIFTADKGSADGQEIMRLQPNGNVGIGTNNPQSMLHIGDGLPTLPTGGYRPWMVRGTQVSWDSDNVFFGLKDEGSNRKDSVIAWGDDPTDVFRFIFTADRGSADGQEIMRLQANGTVGDVRVTGDVYARSQQLSSSRELKENIAELSGKEAVEALKNLNPVKFNFKTDSDKNLHIGFIAEDVPELVATSDRKTLSPMDIVAVLTQALKEQQNTISALAEKVKLLEAKTA